MKLPKGLPHGEEAGAAAGPEAPPEVEGHEHAAHESLFADHAEAKEAKEQAKERAEDADRQETRQNAKTGQALLKGTAQAQAKSAFLQKKAASSGADAKAMAMTSSSYTSLAPVGALQNKLAGTIAKSERPPDAFALLKEARDQGVLFKEDRERDGHTEDQEDPDLAAAVEECIRLCFGLRGVMRIGPGRDEKNEPIIVVVAAQGFSEASFQKVPEKVDRFPTLVAIPFDLLPLRREA